MDKQQKKAEMLSVVQANEFRSELDGFKQYAEEQIGKQDKALTSDGLCKLNFDLGRKAGLEMVLMLLQSYEEELAQPALKVTK